MPHFSLFSIPPLLGITAFHWRREMLSWTITSVTSYGCFNCQHFFLKIATQELIEVLPDPKEKTLLPSIPKKILVPDARNFGLVSNCKLIISLNTVHIGRAASL